MPSYLIIIEADNGQFARPWMLRSPEEFADTVLEWVQEGAAILQDYIPGGNHFGDEFNPVRRVEVENKTPGAVYMRASLTLWQLG